jgi:hypothetical protein
MILSFELNKISFTAEGSSGEINAFLQTLGQIKNVDVQIPKDTENQNSIVKTKKFNKPVSSELTKQQRDYVSSLFVYPASNKTPVGKPAYLMSIMLDGKPRTVKELLKLGNCTSACLRNVINRMRESGSIVEVSAPNLNSDTIVQMTQITPRKLTPAVRKKAAPAQKLNTSQFQNLTI